MATLKERIQNLTQDINPLARRMTEQEVMMARQKDPMAARFGSANTGFYTDEPIGSGVMSDNDTVRINKALLSGVQDPMMSNVDTSVMQPLVDLGFEQQVRTIMTYPQNSPESMQAQQEILNEMGTGMDVDAFVQTVKEVAPKEIQEEILQDRMMPVSGEGDEGIAELLKFAVKQKVDESGNPLLKLGVETGRMNDTTLGHLSEGEAVIPAEVLEANPQAAQSLDETMMQMGIDPDSRIVDTTGQISGIASINPETGLQEFGIGSAFQKLRRKVLKPVSKIAAVVPGPWQAPAIIYNKAESVYNIAKGEGGIGDLMTVMAGGSQKVFGKDGAISNLGKANFGADAGFMDSLKNIGSVKNAAGVMEFNPLQYGKNIAKTYRDDQVGGYFGLLGGGEQPLPEEIQYDPVNQGYINTKTGMPVSDEEIKKLQGSGTNPFIKAIGDRIGLGGRSGLEDAYGTGVQVDKDGKIISTDPSSGGLGMMGKLGIAGLAGLIGKLAYEEAKDQKGVPLTPLTQMDPLGRYNIEAEIARRTGAEMPSRVEFGLTPEGMPALSGGRPTVTEGMVYQPPEKRMMAGGGIMNLNMGGMPRYNFGGGVQYFNQGGTVAMAEGGDMGVAINVEEFPVRDGQINGAGTETSDDIPAMLSDGEFVMTAKAVRGAGSFDVNNNNGILTLTPNGEPTRESGTRVMYKLMEHFSKVA